ncbi:MAG: TonB family protein [Nannocystaceae bacterium]|nr:TonB family protein [Nannocystaceae bacterium]
MRWGLLAASLGAHVVVPSAFLVVFLDETPREDRPQLDLRPIELIEYSPPPTDDVPEILPEPESEPEPEPESEPEPEPTEPEPEPPKPRPRAPKPTPAPDPPAPSPSPSPSGASTPVGDSGGGEHGDGEPSDDEPERPRKLKRQLTNEKPRPAKSKPRKPRPASDGCTTPASKPKAVKKVPIVYTTAGRAAELEGRVVLRAFVGRDGKVTRVKVLKSIGKQVDEPAAAALRGWTFDPARACGKTVESQFTIARDFKL